jgi:hypothetical protein
VFDEMAILVIGDCCLRCLVGPGRLAPFARRSSSEGLLLVEEFGTS